MTPEEVKRRWETRATRGAPALRNELRLLAQRALQFSKITMDAEIYSIPEDRRKNGNPKWVRTGNLLRAETLAEESADSFALTNSMVYARRRHESNKPGYPYQVNAARTAHWRDDALARLRQEQPERWERLMVSILEGHV